MSSSITAPHIVAMKQSSERIVCATAYDALESSLLDEAGVDVILVGDSLANVKLGYPDTTRIGMEEMLHHTAAAVRGCSRALLIADMPFGSYQASAAEAVLNACALMQIGAGAVKLEGLYTNEIAAIVKAGIPVMGHIGMTPQSVHAFGGHKVQGKTPDSAQHLIDTALEIEAAGAFAIVLELIPGSAAAAITKALHIPTIGIGAGVQCDGQIQVITDLFGLSPRQFKHAKPYFNGREQMIAALKGYTAEVRSGEFPGPEQTF